MSRQPSNAGWRLVRRARCGTCPVDGGEPDLVERVAVDLGRRRDSSAALCLLEAKESVVSAGGENETLEQGDGHPDGDGARHDVVLEVEEVVRQARVGAAELAHVVLIAMRLRLAHKESTKGSGRVKPVDVPSAEGCVEGRRQRHQRELPGRAEDRLGGGHVGLDIPIHVGTPGRQPRAGRPDPPAHEHHPGSLEGPGLAAARRARLVYGPMATIVAPAWTLASSNSTAAASGPGRGVTSTVPQ